MLSPFGSEQYLPFVAFDLELLQFDGDGHRTSFGLRTSLSTYRQLYDSDIVDQERYITYLSLETEVASARLESCDGGFCS
jgi:hypothetical protein